MDKPTKTSYIKNWIRENNAFCITAVLLTLMYAALSLLRHWHFQSAGFDLGIFDQAVWNYSNFDTPMGTIRITRHLLADHFHPILILLAPLYWIIPKPETLIVVQLLLWMGGLIPIYLFSRLRDNSKAVSILFVLCYAFFWGITLALNFDFHEVAFAFFAIPWAIYLIQIKQWKWFWACIITLLLTKEEMGPVVTSIGLYLFTQRYYKQAIIATLGGLTWFALATKVFIPYFAGPGGSFGYWTYSKLGSNPFAAIKTVITHPIQAAQLLVTPSIKADTLRSIFEVWFFLPLLSPIMIIGLPLILQRFWSDQSLYWMADFHYSGTVASILVLAMIDTLSRIKKYIPSKTTGNTMVLVVSILVLLANLHFLPRYQLRFLGEKSYWHLTSGDITGYKAIGLISEGASVSAQNGIIPHLSQRKYIYLIHEAQPLYLSEYIVIGNSASLLTSLKFEDFRKFIESKIAGHNYEVVFDENDWVVWHSPDMAGRAPVEAQ